MDWLWNILWFIGLWIVGNFVCSMFVAQILIINRCAKKLLRRIRNDHEYWNSADCNRYLNRTIFINLILVFVASALVLWLIPPTGIYGYFFGLAFAFLLGFSATGINPNNAAESCQIFLRFAKPEMRDEFAELLPMVAQQFVFEETLKKRLR